MHISDIVLSVRYELSSIRDVYIGLVFSRIARFLEKNADYMPSITVRVLSSDLYWFQRLQK